MTNGQRKTIRRWLIRAAGSALFLAILFWFVPIGLVITGISRVGWPLFLMVWVLFLAGHGAAAAKWWALLGRHMPFVTAVRAHGAGLAANLCLPGAAGGDVVRAGMAQLAMKDGGRVVSGSVADRLIDMIALAILAAIGLTGVATAGQWGGTVVIVLAAMILALSACLWVLPHTVPLVLDRLPNLPGAGFARRVAQEFGALGRKPLLVLFALALSVGIQALFVFLAMQLGHAIGVPLGWAVWYLAWPLAKLLAVLPVALNGLGLREATLAGLMVPFGAEAADVIAAGLAWQVVLFASGGLGAVLLWVFGTPPWAEAAARDETSKKEASSQ